MKRFTYDPSRSFRAWLKTLTNHAMSDFKAARARLAIGSADSEVERALDSLEARADLQQQLEDEFDREVRQEAMAWVRLRVEPQTWEAFRLTALEGLSGAEVAKRLAMPVVNVYKAKSNVIKQLRGEVDRLEGGCVDDS